MHPAVWTTAVHIDAHDSAQEHAWEANARKRRQRQEVFSSNIRVHHYRRGYGLGKEPRNACVCWQVYFKACFEQGQALCPFELCESSSGSLTIWSLMTFPSRSTVRIFCRKVEKGKGLVHATLKAE